MKYDVVIIDNGPVQTNNNYLTIVDLRNKKSVVSNEMSHGYEMALLVHERSPDALILILKICDSINDFFCEDVFRAFDYLLKNRIEFDILNISLGALYANHLKFQQDIVIIAANHPQAMSYPALLDGVICVDVSGNINDPNIYVYNKNSVIDLIGANCYLRIQHSNRYTMGKGSSYMTAHFSGILSKELRSNFVTNRRLFADDFFMKNATYVNLFPKCEEDLGKEFAVNIKKAIVFPFNKETMHLASFEDLISFEICGYYDFDISLNIYHFVDEIIKEGRHVQIQPFHKINWNDAFDTMICGHCMDYDRLTHKNILAEVVRNCIKYKKKLYCFDYLTHMPDNISNCYFPHVTEHMIKNRLNSKLYSISKPVLAIMGTSSVQGKYNLQLSLRRSLTQKGYQVSNIGSEPSGYLFGFDAVIPFGYNSNIDLSNYDFIRYLNETVKKAENDNGKN